MDVQLFYLELQVFSTLGPHALYTLLLEHLLSKMETKNI